MPPPPQSPQLALTPSPSHKGDGKGGGKGKTKGPYRTWKSENFPASYDQATPALQEESDPEWLGPQQPEWWQREVELSTVSLEDTSITTSTLMAVHDEDDILDELTEDETSLLDLHFVAIIQQLERQKLFLQQPTEELQQDIETHSGYITFANSLLNPIHHHVIARFEYLIGYTPHPLTATTASSIASNEMASNEMASSPTSIMASATRAL